MTRAIDQMIASEVLCRMSSLVTTLAGGWTAGEIYRDFQPGGAKDRRTALDSLAEQAFELAAPVDDWEEAAIQAGWEFHADDRITHPDHADAVFTDAEQACQFSGVDEPYEREVYEHWAVTDWFADKLEAAGEKVDRDFAGLAIWARTTTGQSIAADGVIQRIYAETHTGLEG